MWLLDVQLYFNMQCWPFTGTFLDSSSLWRCFSSYHCWLRHTLWAGSPFVGLRVAAPSPKNFIRGRVWLHVGYLFSSWSRWRKGGSAWIIYCIKPLSRLTAQTSGLVNLVFSYQTGSFEGEHLFIDKLMVLTELAKANTRLLGLGSKLYPSSMQCMLHKDLSQFIESLSWVRVHLCWQGDWDTEVSLNHCAKKASALVDYYFLFVMYCVPVTLI